METTVSVKNGIDLNRLKDTIAAVKEDPSLANFQFRLTNEWIDGGHNQSVIGGFYGAGKEDTSRDQPFIVANDEPDVLLGTDYAPNPVEFVLHALAGCLTTSMAYHAAAAGYDVEKISTSFEGDLDLRGFLGLGGPGVRNGYKQIRVKVTIEGDLTEDQKQEILKMGPGFSPVFDIVTGNVPVNISLA